MNVTWTKKVNCTMKQLIEVAVAYEMKYNHKDKRRANDFKARHLLPSKSNDLTI